MTTKNGSNIIQFPRSGAALEVFQLRVELLMMPLPIWRSIILPTRADFWDLHIAIQDAMGWEDRHLHQFTVDNPETGERQLIGVPDDNNYYGGDEILSGWEQPVAPYLNEGGHPALYTYDFGDDWQHSVVLEGTMNDAGPEALPRCVAGEGICPPEDCGGVLVCKSLLPLDPDEIFVPEDVVFDNPKLRWQRSFGRD
ncbi:MAG: hypothetical protein ACI9UK_001981 [Candidatus Krumholzibacteriia bacterium]|jgi:hypothetical protein